MFANISMVMVSLTWLGRGVIVYGWSKGIPMSCWGLTTAIRTRNGKYKIPSKCWMFFSIKHSKQRDSKRPQMWTKMKWGSRGEPEDGVERREVRGIGNRWVAMRANKMEIVIVAIPCVAGLEVEIVEAILVEGWCKLWGWSDKKNKWPHISFKIRSDRWETGGFFKPRTFSYNLTKLVKTRPHGHVVWVEKSVAGGVFRVSVLPSLTCIELGLLPGFWKVGASTYMKPKFLVQSDPWFQL